MLGRAGLEAGLGLSAMPGVRRRLAAAPGCTPPAPLTRPVRSYTPTSSMTTTQEQSRALVLDPIRLEVLRSRLGAIAEDAGESIERTAISPVVTESRDSSATILDAVGNLVVGG